MYEVYQDPWEEQTSIPQAQMQKGLIGRLFEMWKGQMKGQAISRIGQGQSQGEAVGQWGSGGLTVGGTQVGGGDQQAQERQGFMALLQSLFGTSKGSGKPRGPWGAYGG